LLQELIKYLAVKEGRISGAICWLFGTSLLATNPQYQAKRGRRPRVKHKPNSALMAEQDLV